MKVLLTKDVSGLGRAGDVKEVSDGHARNFLIPKHLALPATSSLLQKVQKEESERIAKVKKEQEQMNALKNKLENKTFTVKGRASKEHLFAAIKPGEIVEAIRSKIGVELRPEQIVLKTALKSLGLHEVELALAQNTRCVVKLNIESLN